MALILVVAGAGVGSSVAVVHVEHVSAETEVEECVTEVRRKRAPKRAGCTEVASRATGSHPTGADPVPGQNAIEPSSVRRSASSGRDVRFRHRSLLI